VCRVTSADPQQLDREPEPAHLELCRRVMCPAELGSLNRKNGWHFDGCGGVERQPFTTENPRDHLSGSPGAGGTALPMMPAPRFTRTSRSQQTLRVSPAALRVGPDVGACRTRRGRHTRPIAHSDPAEVFTGAAKPADASRLAGCAVSRVQRWGLLHQGAYGKRKLRGTTVHPLALQRRYPQCWRGSSRLRSH